MQNLWAQLERDLKANWKKTAALGVLFLFGCCFWIPMLWGAAKPRRAAAAVDHQAASATSTPTSTVAPVPNGDSSGTKSSFWASLSKALTDDPLFRSADMTISTRDPFAVDESQFPLPVLFAEDLEAEEPPKPVVERNAAPTGLELRSTMIGRTRRVAIINGQLYQLGKEVVANGHSFRLTSIESHHVVLTAGDQHYELALPRTRLKDVLNRDDSASLSEPRDP